MSELIHMRQRMKVVSTIQKITHAMRLISMSTNTRLRSQQNALKSYQEELDALFHKALAAHPAWQHPVLMPKDHTTPTLIILIGSQKGLCGNFNTTLFNFFTQTIAHHAFNNNYAIIAVGKKASEFAQNLKLPVIHNLHEFGIHHINAIAHGITQIIFTAPEPYSHVQIISNYSRTFFAQQPRNLTLIPHQNFDTTTLEHKNVPHHWECAPETVLNTLAHMAITTRLKGILFESLIAEQAARFIAMDNSTRSARTMLDTMRLEYNKTRQALITRELTDLVGSLK